MPNVERWVRLTANREYVEVATQPHNPERNDLCDFCQRPLGSEARLIAGSIEDRRHFCSIACYVRWTRATGSSGSDP
jgi:hypothetical protein